MAETSRSARPRPRPCRGRPTAVSPEPGARRAARGAPALGGDRPRRVRRAIGRGSRPVGSLRGDAAAAASAVPIARRTAGRRAKRKARGPAGGAAFAGTRTRRGDPSRRRRRPTRRVLRSRRIRQRRQDVSRRNQSKVGITQECKSTIQSLSRPSFQCPRDTKTACSMINHARDERGGLCQGQTHRSARGRAGRRTAATSQGKSGFLDVGQCHTVREVVQLASQHGRLLPKHLSGQCHASRDL